MPYTCAVFLPQRHLVVQLYKNKFIFITQCSVSVKNVYVKIISV